MAARESVAKANAEGATAPGISQAPGTARFRQSGKCCGCQSVAAEGAKLSGAKTDGGGGLAKASAMAVAPQCRSANQ